MSLTYIRVLIKTQISIIKESSGKQKQKIVGCAERFVFSMDSVKII